MSGKCVKCATDFSAADVVAKCGECKMDYHPACTSAGSTQNYTKRKNKNWKCDSCKDESNSTSSMKSADEPLEDKRSILDALKVIKKEIIENMDTKLGRIDLSISNLTDDVRSIKTSMDGLDKRQEELSQRCGALEQENARLVEDVRELRNRLQDAEQHSRSANIEIVGIPQTAGEDVFDILRRTATVIGVAYRREDVSIAHRLRLYSRKHSHPPIIVQFSLRTVREMWLSAVRVKRGLEAREIAASFPATKVFINEHLTPNNKALLGRARRLRREGKLHYAGFANGKILVKPREEDAAIRILAMEELDRYM